MATSRLDRDPTRPVYVISVAAGILSVHPRTLRIYEDEGLIAPARTTRNPQPTEPSPSERRKPTKDLGKTTRDLPLVAPRETVIFPEMIVPLQVGREKSVAALNAAVANGGPIALVTQRVADQEEIGSPSELYPVGTLAKIAQIVQLQDGTVRAIV